MYVEAMGLDLNYPGQINIFLLSLMVVMTMMETWIMLAGEGMELRPGGLKD